MRKAGPVTGSRAGHVLMVFAHPHDETLLTGALIPKLVADGNEVHLLCMAPGDDADLVARMEHASAQLGISRVTSLRFSAAETFKFSGDGAKMPPLAQAPESAVAHLIEARIAEIKPSIVITHSPTGDYGHPDHAFCNRATIMAVETMPSTIELYTLAWPNLALTVIRTLGKILGGFRGSDVSPHQAENLPATHVHDVRRFLSHRKSAAQHYRAEIARGPVPMRLLEAAPVAAQRLILGKARLSRIR